MRNLLTVLRVAVLFAASVLSAQMALADTFPARPVRLIVPHPPGGGTDAIARILARWLSQDLRQSVYVDNRPGASGMIGTGLIAHAPPDGLTVGFIESAHAINPVLYRDIPYDSAKSFTPIALVARGLYVVVVRPTLPVNSMQELIAYAKANPGKLHAAISSIGAPGHLAVARLKLDYGINVTEVPYKGTSPAVVDLLGGQVDFIVASFPGVQQLIAAGKLRALAVTSTKRSHLAPTIPTSAEAGVPDFLVSEWYGIVGPAGLKPEVANRLNTAINDALADPTVKAGIEGLGGELAGGSAEELAKFVAEQHVTLGKIVRDANMKVD